MKNERHSECRQKKVWYFGHSEETNSLKKNGQKRNIKFTDIGSLISKMPQIYYLNKLNLMRMDQNALGR